MDVGFELFYIRYLGRIFGLIALFKLTLQIR